MKNRQKTKLLKKTEMIFLKVKQIVDFIAVVGIFYILLYQIKSLRAICKAICQYLIHWCIPIDMGEFKSIYFCLESIFRVAIVLAVLLAVILYLIRVIWDQRLKKQTGNNRFEKSLFRYLQDASVSRCFLITGKWGAGKTYEVNQFFDKYYRYSGTKVFRVSCFGLSSRKDLIEEINHIIEQGDTSIYALIIKVLQFLPVIGEAINKFLKKSYTYTSIKKGSIFIFDDFERITSRTITSEYSGRIYHQSPGMLRDASRTREFDDIKREFQSVERSFQKIEDFVNKNSLREDYDKYIAVTGLINELIESCGMKVVIVCNSDILGEKFLHDVLRSKLSCLEYKKVITPEIQEAVLEQILNNKIFDDAEKQQCIAKYLNTVKPGLTDIMQNTEFRDLRLFRSLVEAFTDTAVLFKRGELTEDFLNSLFNSIMITHLSYYNNSVGALDRFVNGANMEFMLCLIHSPQEVPGLLRIHGTAEEMKWVDVRVSGYWILNLSVPDDTAVINEEWKQYKYAVLEWKMVRNEEALMEEDNFELKHLLFYHKEMKTDDLTYEQRELITKRALQNYDLSKIEVVQGVLDMVNRFPSIGIHRPFQNVLFQVLSEGHADGSVVGEANIYQEYNKFLNRK